MSAAWRAHYRSSVIQPAERRHTTWTFLSTSISTSRATLSPGTGAAAEMVSFPASRPLTVRSRIVRTVFLALEDSRGRCRCLMASESRSWDGWSSSDAGKRSSSFPFKGVEAPARSNVARYLATPPMGGQRNTATVTIARLLHVQKPPRGSWDSLI